MKRINMVVGSFCVNCSLLDIGGKTWIVDPGHDGDRIADALAKGGTVPSGILLTHSHFDHIGGIAELQARYRDLPVYAHPGDFAAFGHQLNQLPPEYPLVPRPANLHPVGEASVTGMEILETPGHTPGGVCYYWREDNLLLSGDTLFAGSVGRTDLPGGDLVALMRSIEVLKGLPDVTVVVPGHGCTTTIGAEKAGNPFFQ